MNREQREQHEQYEQGETDYKTFVRFAVKITTDTPF